MTDLSVDELTASFGSIASAETLSTNIGEFRTKCDQIYSTLHHVSQELDSLDPQTFTEILNELSSYREKTDDLRERMESITARCGNLQNRLNSVRCRVPKKFSRIETGPFLFRCVYKGGVRLRDYPSFTANVLDTIPIVQYGEVVEIKERVFIGGEVSVFLHYLGRGWLVENWKQKKCFERVLES
jgi:hypothetical protein